MPKFIRETLGMLNPSDLIETGLTVSRPSDPFEGLFDDIQTDNLVATYYTIASEYSIPQIAQFHAFDVPAQKSIPAPISTANVEKGLIKVKRSTTELLRQLMGNGVRDEEQLYREVVNQAASLSDAVVDRAKVARAEVLATGLMTINENGINVTVDYGVPVENRSLTIDVGNGADTDLPTQIQTIVDNAADAGVTLTGILTSRRVLSKIRQNEAVQRMINGVNMVGSSVSNTAVNSWFADEYGIQSIITNDQSYSLPYTQNATGDVVTHSARYFPNNVITFYGTVNGMRLGSSLWGVPPEEEIGAYYNVGGSSQSPYVYVTQWAEADPAVLWTKASALYIPVLFSPDSLRIATVTDTPAG